MIFIDRLDLCPTVLYVCVLFPCPEVEGLPQGCNELCTVAVVHVGTSKDVVHVQSEDSDQWWMFHCVAIVIDLVCPGIFSCLMIVDQEEAWIQWVDCGSQARDALSCFTVPCSRSIA